MYFENNLYFIFISNWPNYFYSTFQLCTLHITQYTSIVTTYFRISRNGKKNNFLLRRQPFLYSEEVRFKKKLLIYYLCISRETCFFSFFVRKQDGVILNKESVLCFLKRDFIRAAAAAERKNKTRPV